MASRDPVTGKFVTSKLRDARSLPEFIKEVKLQLEDGSIKAVRRPVKAPGPRSLVVLLSDLHFGKISIPLAHKRLMEAADGILNLELAFDDVRLLFAGDLMEGERIYINQNVKLKTPAFDQYVGVVETVGAMLERIATKHYVTAEFAYGNHERTGKRAHPRSNWCNVVNYTLAQMYPNHKRIQVNQNYEEFLLTKIQNKRVLVTHKGIPYTGSPARNVKVAVWSEYFNADIIFSAHFHQNNVGDFMGRPVICNGSLPGADDNSVRNAYNMPPPRQMWALIEKGNPLVNHFGWFEWRK